MRRANEPWNKRWNGASGREILLGQDYGGKKDWLAHFDYLARFFRHREYVKIAGRPVLAIYNVRHMRLGTSGSDPAPSFCRRVWHVSCGDAPYGCAGSALYLQWYPELRDEGVNETGAFASYVLTGRREGRSWPAVDPCEADPQPRRRFLFSKMVAVWQRRAREWGFRGVHIVATAGGGGSSVADLEFTTTAEEVPTVMQFLPHTIQRAPVTRKKLSAACPPGFEPIYAAFWKNMTQPDPNSMANCSCMIRAAGEVTNDRELVPRAGTSLWTAHRGVFRNAWHSFSSFARQQKSNTLYRGSSYCTGRSPAAFGDNVQKQLEFALEDVGGASSCACMNEALPDIGIEWRRLVIVNSWNDWGEQV